MSQALAESRAVINRLGWERVALVTLAVVQVVLALTLPVAGPFSIDEVVYSEMTRSFTQGFGFFIDNGFDQVASPALATRFVSPTDGGQLAAQYPYGLPLLAAIPYALLGVRGIMVVNALAFVAVVGLTQAIAHRLLHSRWIAWASAGVLAVSTYAWEYSIAIWPHMTTVALGLGSILMLLIAIDNEHRSSLYGCLSGLLFGLAVLNRLDAVLLLPMLAFSLVGKPRWTKTAPSFALGLVPSAILLCVSNWQRWGTFLPFSYGGNISDWLMPVVALGVGLLVALAVVVFVVKRFRPSARLVTFGVIASAAIVLVVPRTREFILDWASGVWTLAVDLRSYRITDEGGLSRLADGTLVYFGYVKKSLLQSAPYLAVTALPLVAAWRTAQRRIAILMLVPVVTYVGFFAPRAWHGGLSFNLRYFLPALPFAAILTAWAIRIVIDRIRGGTDLGRIVRITALVALGVFALGRIALPSISGTSWLLSVPPLALAGATFVAMVSLIVSQSQRVARTTLVLIVAGLTWAAAVAYGYDASATLSIRNAHVNVSTAIAELIDDDTLLFAGWPDNTYGVKDHRENVVIALPGNDDFASVDELITGFAPTRSVFGALSETDWDEMPEAYESDWVEIGIVGDYSVRELRMS